MTRRTVLACLATFCLGFLAARLSRSDPPPALSPDYSRPVRVNTIEGHKVSGVRLIPYRVVREGASPWVADRPPGDGPRYQLVFEGETPVQVYAMPD